MRLFSRVLHGAAVRFVLGRCDGPLRRQIRERAVYVIDELATGWRLTLAVRRVVDRAAVHERALRVDHVQVRSVGGAVRLADGAWLVQQDGVAQLEGLLRSAVRLHAVALLAGRPG